MWKQQENAGTQKNGSFQMIFFHCRNGKSQNPLDNVVVFLACKLKKK